MFLPTSPFHAVSDNGITLFCPKFHSGLNNANTYLLHVIMDPNDTDCNTITETERGITVTS